MSGDINLLRAKIKMLDTERKKYVDQLLSQATSYEEKMDLWMMYAMKNDYPKIDKSLLGDNIVDFIISLMENESIKEEQIIYIDELLGLIYQSFIDLDEETMEPKLAEKGVLLEQELIKYNLGSLKIVF
jgi:hypothetical protein